MKLLLDMLPSRSASLLSLNAIREDLQVSFRAVSHWMDILEAFYYCYRIYPYQSKRYRGLKKNAKLYLWDWSEIENEGARFENLIASHLLKYCHFLYDYEGYKTELLYIRDVNQKEIDFLVTLDKRPWFAVEVKLSEVEASPHLKTIKDKLHIPYIYQVIKKPALMSMIRVLGSSRPINF